MNPNRHLISLCLLASAATANAGTGLNAAIVRFDAEGRHYLYTAGQIKPGDDLYFQTPGKEQLPACCTKRNWKAATLLPSDPVAIDFEAGDKLYRYRLDARSVGKDVVPFVGIAAFGKNLSATASGNGAVRVVAGDQAEDLMLCTSPEGAHLLGQAAGKNVVHLYLYLGVDIDHPTCPADIAK